LEGPEVSKIDRWRGDWRGDKNSIIEREVTNFVSVDNGDTVSRVLVVVPPYPRLMRELV
jgi:hypothetical protein